MRDEKSQMSSAAMVGSSMRTASMVTARLVR